jgi:predicted transcriptional regulator
VQAGKRNRKGQSKRRASLNLSATVWRELRRAATREDRSMSYLAEVAIRELLERRAAAAA